MRNSKTSLDCAKPALISIARDQTEWTFAMQNNWHQTPAVITFHNENYSDEVEGREV